MSGKQAAAGYLADTSEVRSFKFESEKEKYGFVNVGAKVCEVVPDSLADRLGVRRDLRMVGLVRLGCDR